MLGEERVEQRAQLLAVRRDHCVQRHQPRIDLRGDADDLLGLHEDGADARDGGGGGDGEVLDLEAGLNVYLSPTTRVMLHWIGVSAETAAGERENGWAVLGRLQLQL